MALTKNSKRLSSRNGHVEKYSEVRDGPLESDGGGGDQKKIYSQKKFRKKKIFPAIVQKKIPCLEDRPINFT
jgi:hypothetical protein